MTIDPKWRFTIQVIVFIAIGVSQGAVHLTNLIPEAWTPYAVAWCGFIAFIGTGLTTGLSGLGLTTTSQIQAASSLSADQKVALAAATPEVKQIITTPEIAIAAGPIGPGAKVVSKS